MLMLTVTSVLFLLSSDPTVITDTHPKNIITAFSGLSDIHLKTLFFTATAFDTTFIVVFAP